MFITNRHWQISLLFMVVYLLTFLVFAVFVVDADSLWALLFLPALAFLSAEDFLQKTIPDWASIAIAVIGSVWVVSSAGWMSLSSNFLFAASAGALLYLVTEWIFRLKNVDVLGLGDIKLMVSIALCLGTSRFFMCLFLASFVGILLAVFRKPNSTDKDIPFGPLLAYSFFLTWLSTYSIAF